MCKLANQHPRKVVIKHRGKLQPVKLLPKMNLLTTLKECEKKKERKTNLLAGG